MQRVLLQIAAALMLGGAAIGVACSDDGTIDQGRAEATVQDAARQVRQEAREAWGSLRTDANRLIDQVRTRNDPEAKQQLLDRCRDTEERLRRENDSNADRVNQLCDRIRDADPNAQSAWNEIKSQFDELNSRFSS